MSSVDKDLVSLQQARDAVEAAHRAFKILATFDQAKVDRICSVMAQAALRDALRLGTLATEETGYGIPTDKAEKNRFAAEDVWNYFRNLRTVGVISDAKDVIEIVSPRGVVAGIIPSTNPTSTAIFKCLIAIKSRNSIVLSPHPSAVRCITETARVMRDAAVKEGLPAEAIGCLTTTTIEGTEALMKHKLTAVILATGGVGLVRAAYSSGKPAFGVGPGNVPVFIERTAKIQKAVADILTGKCFDNGTICASEQAVIVDAPIAMAARSEFEAQGAKFLTAPEADKLAKIVMTAQRTLNPAIVGKSVDVIARMADLNVAAGTRCLLAEVAGVGRDFPLSIEKLSPILAFYVADGIEMASARCYEILSFGGMGHTAGIHTSSREAAKAYGTAMPAARIIVNSPTTHGAIGFSTALPPSMTLGCGSWGGNVTSDNISPIHLLDVKRIAFETRAVGAGATLSSAASSSAIASGSKTVSDPANISRDEIAAIVDRFLGQRQQSPSRAALTVNGAEEGTMYVAAEPASNAGQINQTTGMKPLASTLAHDVASSNNKIRTAVDFVCEDDVKRAVEKGEKIYVSAKTIITPAAHDLGDAAEVFARK